ncbi:major capsid protein [Paracidovorax anthurii]|uniref:Uncharacterized protein n=1 Tax=Paracidovorax anthurii TaxID=78229 RepID=A0A328ZBT5_9BURK|nr:major capsid protein [Paracidovorax anthurii]RAR83531.1 hypothetical protein AX018_101437 [Paracidovorax anthurii]
MQILQTLPVKGSKLAALARAAKTAVTGVAVTAALSLPAFAAAEQPNVAEVVAYIIAGIVTLALVGNAGLMVKAATAIFAWIRGVLR